MTQCDRLLHDEIKRARLTGEGEDLSGASAHAGITALSLFYTADVLSETDALGLLHRCTMHTKACQRG